MHGQRKPLALLLAIGIVLITHTCVMAQSSYFRNWPTGTSPQEIGKRVAENFLVRKLEVEQGKRQYVIYPEVCAWYGALTVAELTNDRDLKTRLIQKFDSLMADGAKRISPEPHVDYRVFGVVPLEIYLQTIQQKYLDLGKSLADKQWERTTPDGITSEARYWIDDMYMITAVQAHAFRATHDTKYLDRAATTMAAYLDKLQQPNGLFFHAADSPFYWGRGNGWVAAGMTELLRSLPKDHPEAWAETSSTGMFTFAMVTGVKNGWLPAKTYGPAARKAWLGLIKHIDGEANVQDVCVGTNKANLEVGPNLDTQLKYYLARQRHTGDLHGQAPVLWSATALLR